MLCRLAASLALLALASTGLAACGDDDADRRSAPATERAGVLVERGLEEVAAGNDAAASKTFAAALDLDPTNAYAHYNLGYLAQQAGDAGTAREEYDDALATLPTLTSALYNKAILLEQDDLPGAVALYRKVLEGGPDNAPAHMRLGFALVHLGQTREGGDELAEGIRLDPAMRSVPTPAYGD